MRVVVQRAKEAKVQVDEKTIGQIDKGLVLLVGISNEDNENDVRFCAEKIANLRIFEDETGKMNFSVLENEGAILSISQFTLYGDCKKGRRPNFMKAAKPDYANILYEQFNQLLIERGLKVETGKFGAMMDVSLVNDGPVTLIIES
ncbi:D-aminoacyl-tRNA deacylase [Shouchella patagoniensis]|uniref:D-aminoacyl-tRNA deacylase n=1 Tax=Shouchella patagoniensis TaxID=228576 RepID=UPI000994F6E7|nr:D-aminoacyl-tRNA deacylase [Shouchella patagoniensis]